MSLGAGAVISKSLRQKQNGRSSTDNEIYSIDDFIGQIMYTVFFMEAQGYSIKNNTLLQDNHSTIRLTKNGRLSSGKRTKHLDVKIFFATDVIKRGLMNVEYCPTEEMWADVLTKPLQGKAFRVMRSRLMNMPEDYVDPPTQTTGVSQLNVHWGTPIANYRRYRPQDPPRYHKSPMTPVRRSVLGDEASKKLLPPRSKSKRRSVSRSPV